MYLLTYYETSPINFEDVHLLHINHLVLEPELQKIEPFAGALSKELSGFMFFNNCSHIQLHKTTPNNFYSTLQAELGGILS